MILHTIYLQRNPYNEWLPAGRPRDRGLSPDREKNFHFSISLRPALEPTQPATHCAQDVLSHGVKWPGREADHSLETSA
jgi:hypothetical protein